MTKIVIESVELIVERHGYKSLKCFKMREQEMVLKDADIEEATTTRIKKSFNNLLTIVKRLSTETKKDFAKPNKQESTNADAVTKI